MAARARAVLEANWTGAATRPGSGLYPHQWSWDAGFVAIGYAYRLARDEAWARAFLAGTRSTSGSPFVPRTSPYRRADLGVAEEADRPEDHAHDRYVYVLGLLRERDWDDAQIRRDTPFMVQDALFNALLMQAERDLAEIARLLGQPGGAVRRRADRTATRLSEKL